MYSIPDRPFVASDPAVAMSVERWLDRQGYAIAYGHQSARAERGDLLLAVKGTESASQVGLAEAA